MKLPDLKIVLILILIFSGFTFPVFANFPTTGYTSGRPFKPNLLFRGNLSFHEDSIHRLDFRYPDKKRGFKPWIAPSLLISTGTILHFAPAAKKDIAGFMNENLSTVGRIDDYLQYAPVAAVYSLMAFGVDGKNNFGNSSAILLKSFLLNGLITDRLKYWVNEPRPNGGVRSFPSGHTSKAFMFAHFMHREYGEISPWYSVGAYSAAVTVGYMRVAKNAHWISDVMMGAGIGILSTELVYLTHQYKWDAEHLKRFDIFPFQLGNHKGFTLVYNF